MYECLNLGDYDSCLRAYVINNTNRHAYMVRNNNSIKLPRYKCERTKRGFIIHANFGMLSLLII